MSDTSPIRILAVDDEPDILSIYRQVLSPDFISGEAATLEELEQRLFSGETERQSAPVFDVVTCNQGDKAVAMAEEAVNQGRPFAVAFVDVRMPPGPDGIVTASRLRELDRELEIVIVTGYSDYSHAQITKLVPPPHKLLYVQKPFHATELMHFASSLGAKWDYSRKLKESENRFRHVVQDQTELILRFDPQGRLGFANRAAHTFFHPIPEDVGTPEQSVSLADLGPALARDLSSVTRELDVTDKAATLDGRYADGSGDEHWLQWTIRAIRTADGNLEYQAVGQDVSEARKAHSVLNSIIHSIPDALLTVDKEMKVLKTNKAMGAFCSKGSCWMADSVVTPDGPDSPCACLHLLKTTLETGKPVFNQRETCRDKDGEDRVVSISTAILRDPDQASAGAILIIKDITRYAEMERRLNERRGFRGLIGESKAMLKVFELVEQLADLETTVLITGESGTGKELVAEALHFASQRSKKPIVKVNCSALTETLLESELFGHVKGAFTGAIRDMPGRFKAAGSGTIFLDEIGDVSSSIQLKLLRVLEQKEFERVGDVRTIRSEARVLAATNADLKEKVADGEFREDLFYRLSVVTIRIPPLRERGEDIRLLARHFFAAYSEELGKPILDMAPETMDAILAHRWPGNVRELKHAVEHACIMCNGDYVLPEHLPLEVTQKAVPVQQEQASPGQSFALESSDIQQALVAAKGNKTRAAELLGISRVTLYRHMAKLGMGSE